MIGKVVMVILERVGEDWSLVDHVGVGRGVDWDQRMMGRKMEGKGELDRAHEQSSASSIE